MTTRLDVCGHCSKPECSCMTDLRSDPNAGCETGVVHYFVAGKSDVEGKTVTKRLFCNGAERDRA